MNAFQVIAFQNTRDISISCSDFCVLLKYNSCPRFTPLDPKFKINNNNKKRGNILKIKNFEPNYVSIQNGNIFFVTVFKSSHLCPVIIISTLVNNEQRGIIIKC